MNKFFILLVSMAFGCVSAKASEVNEGSRVISRTIYYQDGTRQITNIDGDRLVVDGGSIYLVDEMGKRELRPGRTTRSAINVVTCKDDLKQGCEWRLVELKAGDSQVFDSQNKMVDMYVLGGDYLMAEICEKEEVLLLDTCTRMLNGWSIYAPEGGIFLARISYV